MGQKPISRLLCNLALKFFYNGDWSISTAIALILVRNSFNFSSNQTIFLSSSLPNKKKTKTKTKNKNKKKSCIFSN